MALAEKKIKASFIFFRSFVAIFVKNKRDEKNIYITIADSIARFM